MRAIDLRLMCRPFRAGLVAGGGTVSPDGRYGLATVPGITAEASGPAGSWVI